MGYHLYPSTQFSQKFWTLKIISLLFLFLFFLNKLTQFKDLQSLYKYDSSTNKLFSVFSCVCMQLLECLIHRFTDSVTLSTIWSSMVPYHMALYGPIWPSMVQYSPVRPRTAPYGPILSHMAHYGPVLAHVAPYGPMWPIWSCIVNFDPVWSRIVLYSLFMALQDPICMLHIFAIVQLTQLLNKLVLDQNDFRSKTRLITLRSQPNYFEVVGLVVDVLVFFLWLL